MHDLSWAERIKVTCSAETTNEEAQPAHVHGLTFVDVRVPRDSFLRSLSLGERAVFSQFKRKSVPTQELDPYLDADALAGHTFMEFYFREQWIPDEVLLAGHEVVIPSIVRQCTEADSDEGHDVIISSNVRQCAETDSDGEGMPFEYLYRKW
ncbi:MAG: hypothetical protein ACYCOU_07270 [Sulfobacillus sp.]